MLLILRCLAIGLAVSPSLSMGSSYADLAATVAGLQRRYAAVSSVRADFQQTYRGTGVVQTEGGVLYMKKPGLMRWEYRDPEVKLFIADRRTMYLYVPEDRQVLIRSVRAADLRSTPLQFLVGGGDIQKSFQPSWEPQMGVKTEGALLLRLTPRSAEADYEYVVIECDANNYDLRRIIIHEPTGNTSEFQFSNVKFNLKIDDRQFQFKVPKGVEIVRLDEK